MCKVMCLALHSCLCVDFLLSIKRHIQVLFLFYLFPKVTCSPFLLHHKIMCLQFYLSFRLAIYFPSVKKNILGNSNHIYFLSPVVKLWLALTPCPWCRTCSHVKLPCKREHCCPGHWSLFSPQTILLSCSKS